MAAGSALRRQFSQRVLILGDTRNARYGQKGNPLVRSNRQVCGVQCLAETCDRITYDLRRDVFLEFPFPY
jgi:hypothetical protein